MSLINTPVPNVSNTTGLPDSCDADDNELLDPERGDDGNCINIAGYESDNDVIPVGDAAEETALQKGDTEDLNDEAVLDDDTAVTESASVTRYGSVYKPMIKHVLLSVVFGVVFSDILRKIVQSLTSVQVQAQENNSLQLKNRLLSMVKEYEVSVGCSVCICLLLIMLEHF